MIALVLSSISWWLDYYLWELTTKIMTCYHRYLEVLTDSQDTSFYPLA